MMKRKMCVITGANSGIGKAAAVQINQAGYHVILACRNPSRGEAALEDIRAQTGNSAVELMIVDMSLQSSIKQFADTFQSKYKSLDVLIHNAAIFDITQKEKMITGEGVESIWATNHIGPVQLSDLLMEPLKQSQQGRIITVSSKGLIAYPFLKVDLEDPEFIQRKFSVQKAYYQSKLAQVMYTYWLADELKETKITANCIRVANVKIDIDTRYPNTSKFARSMYAIKSRFSISPEEMAETYTYLGVSDQVSETTGKYFDDPTHIVGSSKYSRDSENINQVMALTRKYLHYWDGFFITDRV
jgi:NAD(P)-dependent dehydrogenase (short-subunit alcohol dehydrogenase family)